MKVLVLCDSQLTNQQFHSKNRPCWKLFRHTDDGGKLPVPFPEGTRGDHKVRVQIDLETGYYELTLGEGVGSISKRFFVNVAGELLWLSSKNASVA